MEFQRLNAFLAGMPVSLFGGVMGLCGLSFAWHQAGIHHPGLAVGGQVWGLIAVAAFVLLTIFYIGKVAKYPAAVHAEFFHPISVSFFGTFIISLLLLPGILKTWSVPAAVMVWSVGVVLMLAFALYVLRYWLGHAKQPDQVHPAWIIPVVGTLDVPIVGMQLPVPHVREICTFFFAVGALFTIILLTIIFARLLMQPLPAEQQAPLLILTGPLALAFAGYEKLAGPDLLSSVIFYADFFLLLLIGSKIVLLPFRFPFNYSWWSVSFPLVAVTLACHQFSVSHHNPLFTGIFWGMLVVSTVVITFLLIKTFVHIASHPTQQATPPSNPPK